MTKKSADSSGHDRLRPPLQPATWPQWLLVGLLYAATRLPFSWQHRLGRGLGWILLQFGPKRREVTRINLELAFPEWTPEQREHVVREHFAAAGIGVLETVSGWWAGSARFTGRYTIEGLEHLDQALAGGRGALLVSAHFTDLEILARILSLHRRFAAMYRPNRNPVVDYLFKRNREFHTLGAIERNDIKGLLRSLKRNAPVWYAPDQGGSGRQYVVVPFFAEPASTQTATHRIAKVSKAPVLPFFGRRLPDGRYLLTIAPALADFPSDDAAADTARINRLIETAVLAAPEQYFWSHRRYKAREGLADPYPPR